MQVFSFTFLCVDIVDCKSAVHFLFFPFQNFSPVPYPNKDFGKFYTGDSYIILNVCTSTCVHTIAEFS